MRTITNFGTKKFNSTMIMIILMVLNINISKVDGRRIKSGTEGMNLQQWSDFYYGGGVSDDQSVNSDVSSTSQRSRIDYRSTLNFKHAPQNGTIQDISNAEDQTLSFFGRFQKGFKTATRLSTGQGQRDLAKMYNRT